MTLRRTALAAVACSALACSHQGAGGPPRVPVTVARAERRPVPYDIDATGTVEPRQTVSVQAQVSGVVQDVLFHEGDEVRAGQALFQIDPRPYQAALDQAKANLARDLAQAQSAVADADRYQALVAKEYVTAQDALQKRATADALLAAVRADSAALQNAELNLGWATVRAPITGRTGALLVHTGNLVKVAGDPLVTINQIRPILVRFSVPEQNLADIQKYRGGDLPVLAFPSKDDSVGVRGRLSFVDNNVDTTTGTVLLKGQFENADGVLWPGEFVNVRLELYVQNDAIVIPAPAVVTSQTGTTVFLVHTAGSDATVSVQNVTVQRMAGSLAVIASGVQVGDVVVTDGQLRLVPGAHVDIKASGNAGRETLGAQ
ncbi:MAG TPA: efflux RND transporter periplasmic adaptor subunit [Gemmatimonadales bacterium]|nr:efflux RND transporter periplasmic adaptor subunit [Gemmatimonadales bacterium]